MATAQSVILTVVAATSTPVTGTANATSTTSVFTPQLGRDIYITLTGTWVGTVQLERSTNGTNFNKVTIGGGQNWGRYTGNCDEVVETPTDAAATYRLSITLTSGSVGYRLAQ